MLSMLTNDHGYSTQRSVDIMPHLQHRFVTWLRFTLSFVWTTQITMTTDWLLLLLLIVSSQSVDSQSTTDDETCGEGGLLSELRRDIERLLDNQQQLQLQLQTLTTSRKSYTVNLNLFQSKRTKLILMSIECWPMWEYSYVVYSLQKETPVSVGSLHSSLIA